MGGPITIVNAPFAGISSSINSADFWIPTVGLRNGLCCLPMVKKQQRILVPCDCAIKLLSGVIPPWGRISSITKERLWRQRLSSPPAGVWFIFVAKKLLGITVQNRNPLPLTVAPLLLNTCRVLTVCTKLTLRNAYRSDQYSVSTSTVFLHF